MRNLTQRLIEMDQTKFDMFSYELKVLNDYVLKSNSAQEKLKTRVDICQRYDLQPYELNQASLLLDCCRHAQMNFRKFVGEFNKVYDRKSNYTHNTTAGFGEIK